jgi:predicted HicB family RNase H-like nuclease
MASKTEVFQIRLESELKEKAEKTARKKGISLAGYIRMCLIEAIDRSEQINEVAKAGQQPDKA